MQKNNSKALFNLSHDELNSMPLPKVPISYAINYILDIETPGRIVCDVVVRRWIKFLEGPGKIIELGGMGDYYRKFAEKYQPYEVTNLNSGDRIIDMTDMALDDNSVEAFVSIFALEHIYEYEKAVEECYRCLKPSGRMLLVVPFLYYYHGAPDDYFRFSHTALDRMLRKFNIVKKISAGNRWFIIAEFLQEKVACGSKSSFLARTALRILGVPFNITGIFSNQHDQNYAIAQIYLLEKH